MRVISIKNYAHDLRVIIQLMQYHNKVIFIPEECELPSVNWKILGIFDEHSQLVT